MTHEGRGKKSRRSIHQPAVSQLLLVALEARLGGDRDADFQGHQHLQQHSSSIHIIGKQNKVNLDRSP